jgi:hypothetical protein
MSFGKAHVRRPPSAYCAVILGICLAAVVIAFGFRSTELAMLAEAALQQSRTLPSLSDQVSTQQNANLNADVLSRALHSSTSDQ